MNELQFSISYFFRELAGGDRRERTLEEAPAHFPAQIPVPSSFTSYNLFCPSPESQQGCTRVKPRFGYLWLNHPAIRFGSWCILLAWQWIHLFIFCLQIFYWLHNTLNPLKSYVHLNSCFEGHSNGSQKWNKTVFPTKDMRISQTTEYSPLRRERPDWGGGQGGGVKGELALSVMLHYFKRKIYSRDI